jgi:gamma-glutamyltranspeptidase/glutathione hydrolase
MRRLVVMLCATLLGAAALADERPAPEAAGGARPVAAPAVATRHMIAAANPHAAEAGLAILRAGGSALDAAIAAQLVLNLVEPQSSGIGGGAFLLHWSAAAGAVTSYDGRETAPAAADPGRFLDAAGKPLRFLDAVPGGRSVGVPGLLRMLDLAHRAHGRLPWARLFEPAIALAERGFAVSPRLHALIGRDPFLPRLEPARGYFLRADGSPRAVGETLVNKPFAETLRAIAAGGADAFYRGEIARDIAATVRGAPLNPGDMTETDLAGYRAVERPAVCGPYRRFRVCGMGPPSSGGVAVLQVLGLLQRFDLGRYPPLAPEAVHLVAEAERLAYADRALYLADADFVPVPVKGLLDADYLAARAGLIRLDRTLGTAIAGQPPRRAGMRLSPDAALTGGGTSHVSAADAAGNMVALTTSIESAFGSRLMVRGFLLNNQLTDFSFLPEQDGVAVANRVEPGKRPRSSMAPTLVFDAGGKPVLSIGSPGGSAIINYVVKTLVAHLEWGLDPQAAIALAHFGSRNGPTELEADSATAPLRPALEARGHAVRVIEQTSGLHAIARAGDRLLGGADPRREGVALGD